MEKILRVFIGGNVLEREVKSKKKTVEEDNIAKSITKKPETKKSKKKKKTSPLVPILCLIIGILLGVILIMVFFDKEKPEVEVEGSTAVAEEDAKEENVKSSIEEMLETEEAFEIETSYGKLYFPKKWENQVRVEAVEGDAYTVQFFGTVEGKPEQHLFNVVCGGTDGILVGTWGDMPVYIMYADIAVDDTWTQEELDTIYAMQEDVNYLMGMLSKDESFTPVQ